MIAIRQGWLAEDKLMDCAGTTHGSRTVPISKPLRSRYRFLNLLNLLQPWWRMPATQNGIMVSAEVGIGRPLVQCQRLTW